MTQTLNAPSCADKTTDWHDQFLRMLPAIERYARRAFSRLNAAEKEEGIQAVAAHAAAAYARLAQLQKQEAATATTLAKFAVKQHRAGRLLGSHVNCRDVGSVSCRRRGCVVHALSELKDSLCETKRATPAEIAACRIDLGDWLQTLSARDQRLALALASGEPTSGVARIFQITAGRVSQLRQELYQSWLRFTGEAAIEA